MIDKNAKIFIVSAVTIDNEDKVYSVGKRTPRFHFNGTDLRMTNIDKAERLTFDEAWATLKVIQMKHERGDVLWIKDWKMERANDV
uniref:Uncharacterized protein n=1 Tax=Rhizobium phage LG08 TaxID=3129229 RepID=A0AAU8HY97_9CAUD